MNVIGLDIGFGFTKATNGRDTLVFKSVFGEATDIPFREQFVEGQDDYLHIELEGNGYFVGELAERQSSVRFFTLDQGQFITRFARPLALAALSRLAERNVQINLVTGLPVGFYRDHREELAQLLQGRHPVTVIERNGERRETVVSVNKVRVIPQPFGSLFNLMLNDDGEAGAKRFLQEKVGIIDIGFRTADYAVAQRTNYLGRGARTTESGISQAFAVVADKLQDKSGVRVELYRLYEAAERGWIKVHGQRYEIKPLIEQAFGQLAADVANQVNRLWADDWDIDAIVVSGGGGAVLAPHLKPLLQGEVLPLPAGTDSRVNNARGYYKYARHLWARGRDVPAARPAAAS